MTRKSVLQMTNKFQVLFSTKWIPELWTRGEAFCLKINSPPLNEIRLTKIFTSNILEDTSNRNIYTKQSFISRNRIRS